MPRLKLIGELAQALAGGPMWEPGEERDLSDADAVPYLNNANWRVTGDRQAGTASLYVAPAGPLPASTIPEEAT